MWNLFLFLVCLKIFACVCSFTRENFENNIIWTEWKPFQAIRALHNEQTNRSIDGRTTWHKTPTGPMWTKTNQKGEPFQQIVRFWTHLNKLLIMISVWFVFNFKRRLNWPGCHLHCECWRVLNRFNWTTIMNFDHLWD